ncbi:unnamed protein product [Hymenolepis diminuta]|uniref:Uncharacterized protein n=1 Tax=Hymenolepis diminuta TaxID=6216 RepID=A0A564ZA61_HYMDI|nr:unnamed protein product [Hymenolepis diminuta]
MRRIKNYFSLDAFLRFLRELLQIRLKTLAWCRFYPLIQRTNISSTMIMSSKRLNQRNHIRGKSKVGCLSKRSLLVDDKCKEPEEIVFAKNLFFIPRRQHQNWLHKLQVRHHQCLFFSQTKVPWSHIGLSSYRRNLLSW